MGKMRPSTAVGKYAKSVEGVELVTASGKRVIDAVIDNLLDPANRNILLNPLAFYSAVDTCKNNFGKINAIQNFATTIVANDLAIKALASLMRKTNSIDECADEATSDPESDRSTL